MEFLSGAKSREKGNIRNGKIPGELPALDDKDQRQQKWSDI